jgi:hypothetical protein
MQSRFIRLMASSMLLFFSSLSLAQEPSVAPAQKTAPAAKTPLTPAEIEQQQQMAITAYEAGEYLKFVQATMRLRNARPYEPQYMVGMVVGSALVGRPKTAYTYMHKMQQQGLSYDFSQTADTESVRNTEVYDYLNSLLVKAGEPNGISKTAAELPKSGWSPEAMAWDASAGRFLVGALEDGIIYSVTADGKVSELLKSDSKNGLRAIYGLEVDAERKRLWVSSTATPAFGKVTEGEPGKTALLEFDLDSLELLNRFEPPADQYPHFLGSIGLTPEGDVFVLDRAVPQVYIKPAAANSMSLFMSNYQLTGLRDLAMSNDGKLLYLADAALGILVVNLDNNAVSMLMGPEALNLGGISGIDWARGSLYMVQNGITPQRLLRLDLDATGINVINIIPLASGLELYDMPSFGRVQGEDVYYFASSNLKGKREDEFKPLILRTPLEPEEGAMTAEEQLFMKPDPPAKEP